MSTLLPSAIGNSNVDEVTDEIAEARSDINSAILTLDELLAALGALSLLNLHGTSGLEVVAQGGTAKDLLRVKLQNAAGLALESLGLRLDFAGLPGPASASLETGDQLVVRDASAGTVHKLTTWSIASFLTSIAGTNLAVSGAKLTVPEQTAGPTLITGPADVTGAASYSYFGTALEGLNAWRIALADVGGNNSGVGTQLQLYDDGILVTASNYAGSSGGGAAFSLTGNNTSTVYGYVDIWLDIDGRANVRWSLLQAGTTYLSGQGRYTAALTKLNGFRLVRGAGILSNGMAAVYKLPQWKHTL